MSPREAFKVGFLLWCADRGFTPEQTRDFVKHAKSATKVAGLFGYPAKIVASIGGPLLGLAALAGVGAPAALGGLVGHHLGKGFDTSEPVEEAKVDELLAEYERLTDQAKRKLALKQLYGKPTLASAHS